MFDFTAGRWRPATGGMGAALNASANDLVARTLAQHGLAAAPDAVQSGPGSTGPGSSGSGASGTPASALQDMLARFQRPTATGAEPDLPEGATFDEGHQTCTAGGRRYRCYVPASARGGAAGLVLMLHGCTQSPEDFAAGTGMNALAEAQGLVVLYPHQARGDNAQSCWNWFSRGDQRRDRGEPAILAGLVRDAASRHDVPGGRVFVAGLSAGAAMAAILGEAYPDLFAAVGAHSGLPAGCAKDLPSAYAAMAGRGADPAAGGPAVRTIVFHGSADSVVHPSNGERIARRALDRGPAQSLQKEDNGIAGGRGYRRCTTYGADGIEAVEYWSIDGLGHAWSGGRPAGSYTDAQGPDASAEMLRFFLAGPAAG